MVLPIVDSIRTDGPFRDSVPWSGGVATPISYEKHVVGKKQKFPYTISTPVVTDVMKRVSGLRDCNGWAVSPYNNAASTAAINKARAKFTAELGQSSSLGATLTAEARQTSKLLSSGVLTALLSAKAVARGDLGKAAKLLNFHPPEKVIERSLRRRKVKDTRWEEELDTVGRKVDNGRFRKKIIRQTVWVMPNGKQVAKSAANKWLWWSYGVRPLQQDLYNALDILQRPLPYAIVRGRGTGVDQWSSGTSTYKFKHSCKIAAHVTVKNPNLWLANQLGLINPAQWLNEAIPLSFVIDWFSNWSQVLSQYTDFVGLEIAEPVTTNVGTVTWLGHFIEPFEITWTRFSRELSIPSAKLQFAYERFQWQRGANAISLLVGLLRKA